MPKFRTQFDGSALKAKREKNPFPSLTVPDQSMSIKEMISRHSRGLPIKGVSGLTGYDTVTGEDSDFDDWMPDFRTLDLADIEEMKNLNAQTIAQLRTKLNDKARELNEKKAAEAREKWFQEELKRRSSESTDIEPEPEK